MSTGGTGDDNINNPPMADNGTEQQNHAERSIASGGMHKLPLFWLNMPEIWFIQAEQIFALNRITSDMSKYRHVVAVLPQEVMGNVIDLLKNPPETNKYETLKEALIARHSLSENKRLEELLSSSEIGDRSPSAFFRDMENIMGSSNIVNIDLLKRLWLRKLPEQVKIQVTSSNFEDMALILTLADKVWEVTHTSSIASVTSKPPQTSSNKEDQLIEAIRMLSLEVSSLKKDFNHRRSSQFSQNRRGRSRSRSKPREGKSHCWYHAKFGDKANKCIQPCSYNSDKKNADLNV